jgi:hypothetical protein
MLLAPVRDLGVPMVIDHQTTVRRTSGSPPAGPSLAELALFGLPALLIPSAPGELGFLKAAGIPNA